MDVISQLDVAAAQKAAKDIDRIFVGAGKSTGQAAGKAIGDGVEKEVTAAGRSAGQAAGKAIEKEVVSAGKSAGQSAGKSMSDEIDRATRQVGSGMLGRFSVHGAGAGRRFGGAFGSSLAQSIPVVSGFTSAMAGYETAAGKAGAVAGRALGVAFTTAATGLIGAAGYTLFKGFERYQSIDEARVRLENLNKTLEATGRQQLNVGAVMSTVEGVVTGTRFSLDQAFGVASKALSSATGPLDRFMTVVADAAAFSGGQIGEIGNAFIKIANQGKVSMGELTNELIDLPVQAWLAETMGKTTAEISKMISENKVGLEDLMTAVEFGAKGMAKGSADSIQGAIEQMRTAVSRTGANFLSAIFGAPTDDANSLVDAINSISEKLNQVNAWVVANQDTIKRYFDQAVDAVGDVFSAIQKVLGILDDLGIGVGDVVTAFVAWKSISGVAALITNLDKISLALSSTIPASAAVGAAGITAALAKIAVPLWLTTLIEDKYPNFPIQDQPDGEERIFPGWVPILPFWEDRARDFFKEGPAPEPFTPGSGLQELLLPGGNLPQPLLPGQGLVWQDGKGWVMPDGSLPPFMTTGPAGSPITDPSGASDAGSKAKGPRLPNAPVVPYDTTLPPGMPGLPQTAALFGAESSYLDSRHKLAEKRARLTQLEQTADATEEDRLNARNEVIEAERDFQASEMRLNEARVSALEKSNKQLKGLTKDLGQLGASLDADFGISKGLAGIAENITKFVANLAAAPLLGQLAATSAMSPTQGGHGIMGILGAQGVFGSQYQNNQYAEAAAQQAAQYTASAMGPAAFQPGTHQTAAVGGGHPYGLPGGTAINYGQSDRFPPWVRQLEQMFGVKASTYSGHQEGHRNEPGYAPNPQGQNRGIDWSGPVENMQLLADYLATIPGAMEQVIWQNPKTGKTVEIAGGRPQPGYFSSDLGGHQDHVHTRQSQSIPLPGTAATYAPTAYAPATTPVATSPGPGNFGTSTGAGFPGMGGPPQAGGVPQFGTPQPATRIGGVAPTPGAGGGGGVGIQSGGLIDMGIQAGAMGLDMMAPGAGQAAAMGMKLANRGIEYAGQVAGIGVSGLMETFLPTGGSELANNNWLTRIVGGLAGAAPALPNLAGNKSEPPLDGSQVQAQQGQQGQQGNTFGDINVTTNREDGAAQGRDIAFHLQAQHAAPGM